MLGKNSVRNLINLDIGNCVVPQEEGIRWAEYMYALTPIEQKSDGMWYKREDAFAPLGINSINGSKCRQLLYLFETLPPETEVIVHATNLNSSPQTPMTAAMAQHYGIRCIQVAGGTTVESMNKKDLPLFATMFGTEYDIGIGSGFNVVIQKRVQDIMETLKNAETIERDITLDHALEQNDAEAVLKFHDVGAYQTKNFPDDIEDLIIPFGSANSTTSIMLGLSRDKPKNLKRIHLVNVGVDKRKYMFERLEMMQADISDYEIVWHESGEPYSKTFKGVKQDDITFHPRYEAKCIKHIRENHPELINDKTLFWIIGSYPDIKSTSAIIKKPIPKTVNLWEGTLCENSK